MAGFIDDRAMYVQPDQVVRTAWVDVDLCLLGSRVRMAPEAVEKKYREILQQGIVSKWPPIVGHWEVRSAVDRFIVDDGRHEFLASLMLGRDRVFVAWLEDQENADS